MGGPVVKGLNTTDGPNRFKFASFQDQIARARVRTRKRIAAHHAPLHELGPADEDADQLETESFFRASLDHWRECNLTAAFRAVNSAVYPHSQSLGQVLFHRDEIVAALETALTEPSGNAIEATLDLVEALAQDLQDELYSSFDRLFAAVAGLRSHPVVREQAPLVQRMFETIAALFKVFSSRLYAEMDAKVALLVFPLLTDSRVHVRRFSSEALGFILRKLAPETLARTLAVMFSDARVVEASLALVVGEAMRGAPGHLHSKAAAVAQRASAAAVERPDSANNAQWSEARALGHVWETVTRWDVPSAELSTAWTATIGPLAAAQGHATALAAAAECVRAASRAAGIWEALVDSSGPLLISGLAHADAAVVTVAQIALVALLVAAPASQTAKRAAPLLQKALGAADPHMAAKLFLELHGAHWPGFLRAVRPSVGSLLARLGAVDRAAGIELAATLAADRPALLAGIQPPCCSETDPLTLRITALEMRVALAKDSAGLQPEAAAICREALSDAKASWDDRARAWSACVAVGATDDLAGACTRILEQFPAREISAAMISALKQWCESPSGAPFRTRAQLENVYEKLRGNLQEPLHALRLVTLELFASFPQDQMLATDGDSAEAAAMWRARECNVFSLLADAERLHPNRSDTHRAKVMALRRAVLLYTQRRAPAFYRRVWLEHIVGLLSDSFAPLWKDVEELARMLVQGWAPGRKLLFEIVWARLNEASAPEFSNIQADERFDADAYRVNLVGLLCLVPGIVAQHADDEVVPWLLEQTDPARVDSAGAYRLQRALLGLVAKLGDVQRLRDADSIYQRLLGVLAHGDGATQQRALACVFGFRTLRGVQQFKAELEALADDRQVREQLVRLSGGEVSAAVRAEDRAALWDVVASLLYGKLCSRRQRVGGSFGNRDARRTAVFAWLSGTDASCVGCVWRLMVRGASGDSRQRRGFLMLARAFISQILPRFPDFVHPVMTSLVSLLEVVPGSFDASMGSGDEGSGESDAEVSNASSSEDDDEPMAGDAEVSDAEVSDADALDADASDAESSVDSSKEPKASEEAVKEKREDSKPQRPAKKTADIQETLGCIARVYRAQIPGVDLDEFTNAIFARYLTPEKLARLATDYTQSRGALLQLLLTWAEGEKTVQIVTDGPSEVLPRVLELAASAHAKKVVVDAAVGIVVAATGSSVAAVQRHVAAVLTTLQTLWQRDSGRRLAAGSPAARLLTVATVVAESGADAVTGAQAAQLATLLLPALEQPTRVVPDASKMQILGLVRQLWVRQAGEETRVPSETALLPLFARLEERECREALVALYSAMQGPGHELVTELNAWSRVRVGEPDYARRLDAMAQLHRDGLAQTLPTAALAAVVRNLIHLVGDANDYSTRSAAGVCIGLVVARGLETEADSDMETIVHHTIAPACRQGMRSHHATVRHEWLVVLEQLVRASAADDSRYGDMRVLLGDASSDGEASFFRNIEHLQQHRRVRAMQRVAAAAPQLRPATLAQVIVPLLLHVPHEAERVREHDLVNAAISALAAIAPCLNWSQYAHLVKGVMDSVRRKPWLERVLVRLLTALVEAFPTALLNSDSPQAPRVRETARGRIVPFLFRLLMQEAPKDAPGADAPELRTPVAVALARLIVALPDNVGASQRPKLLGRLAELLKSRFETTRDAARQTLARVAAILGAARLKETLDALGQHLQRGFHMHVRAYALHDVLSACVPFDGAKVSPVVVPVLVEQLFGTEDPAEEVGNGDGSDDGEKRPPLKERRLGRAFETIELLASQLAPGAVEEALVAPVQRLMLETHSNRTGRRLDEVLRRIAAGVARSDQFEMAACVELCRRLVGGHVSLARDASAKLPSSSFREAQREATFLVELKRPDIANESATAARAAYYDANAHRLVALGLALVTACVKQGRAAGGKAGEALGALVAPAAEALYAPQPALIAAALRALGACITLTPPLEALNKPGTCEALVARALELLAGGTGDVPAAAFRFVGATLRARTGAAALELTPAQLRAVLRVLEAELADEGDAEAVQAALQVLKTLLHRKQAVPELYDVVEQRVRPALVSASSLQTRALAARCTLQFMLDFPQGAKRVATHVAFLVANLQYEHASGRRAAVDALAAFIARMPAAVVDSHREAVFLPAALRSVLEPDSETRQAARMLVVAAAAGAGAAQLDRMLAMPALWLSADENGATAAGVSPAALRAMGAEVISVVVPGVERGLGKSRKEVLRAIGRILEGSSTVGAVRACAQEADTCSLAAPDCPSDDAVREEARAKWASLGALRALSGVPGLTAIAAHVVPLLAHSHWAVRHAALEFLSGHFAAADPAGTGESLISGGDAADTGAAPLDNLGDLAKAWPRLATASRVRILIAMHLALLESPSLDDASAGVLVGNVVFLARCGQLWFQRGSSVELSGVEGEADSGDDAEDNAEDTAPLAPLVRRLGKLARKPQLAKSALVQTAVIKMAAAIIHVLDAEAVAPLAKLLADPLYRAAEEEAPEALRRGAQRGKEADDAVAYDQRVRAEDRAALRVLASQALDLLKEKIGPTAYLAAYEAVHRRITATRDQRRAGRQQMAVRDPQRHAQHKLARNQLKRRQRQRRAVEQASKRQRALPSVYARGGVSGSPGDVSFSDD